MQYYSYVMMEDEAGHEIVVQFAFIYVCIECKVIGEVFVYITPH